MDIGSKSRLQMPPPQQMRPSPRQFTQPQATPQSPPRVQKTAPRSATRSRSPQHQMRVEEIRQTAETSERSFRNPDHSSLIMTQLSSLWKSGRYVDAAILVGEVKLQAHRMVLFAASPYLRASFDNLNPTTELRLKMPADIKLDIVFQFLTYIYDGVLRLNPDNAASLLKLSLMLRMEHLAMCCREYMAQAVKQGLMPPTPRHDDVVPPLLVLVDHRPPDTGGGTAEMCTQTAPDPEQEPSPARPRVEFERVFGEGDDRSVDIGVTQFNGSFQNIQSDVDIYRNYEEEASAHGDDDDDTHAAAHGTRAVHTQNDNDDDDAMPMMIIKNEHIDPGYELSLNPQHSDSEREDSASPTNEALSHPAHSSPVAQSNSHPDYNPSSDVSTPTSFVPGENVPENVPEHGVSESVPSDTTSKISSQSSPCTPESVDHELTPQLTPQHDSKSSLSEADNISGDVGNDSKTFTETSPTIRPPVRKSRTDVTESIDSNVHSNSDQSLPVGGSCDQSPPQFGTEEFLNSDFDCPMPRQAKTEPEDPV